VAPFAPRKGDFISVAFARRGSHEQHGRRPALVVSNDAFNDRTGFCMVCPVTRTDRGYPFHVRIPAGLTVTGVVMADQIRSIDHRARAARPITRAPESVLDEVLAILDACLF
jgi:mRNA interferase MazF